MDLLLIHFVALVWLSVAAAWRWTDRGADLLLAAIALAWANIVATLLILSALRSAHSTEALLAMSLSLGAAVALLAWRFPAHAETPTPTNTSPFWRIGGLLVLAALAGGSLAAAASFAPFAPAALDEALPRAFLLLGKTGLLPRDAAGAAEALFTLDRSALHVWVLTYHPGLAALSFVNLIGWILAGVAVYRFSTLAGAGPHAASLATVCALASLPILAQAATLDHHLWAATSLLGAACFLAENWQPPRKPSAMFAGLLAGLAAGSSAGALAIVLVAIAWAALDQRRRIRLPWRWFAPGLVFGLLPLLLNAALALSTDLSAFAAALPRSLGSIAGSDFLNGPSFTGGPVAPTELSVGPGIFGAICLASAFFALRRLRGLGDSVALLALVSSVWLGGAVVATLWHPFDAREWVPVLLLAAPSVATIVARGQLSRPLAGLGGAALLVGVVWSAHDYLWRNAWRPLGSLWDRSIALRLPSELSQSLEFHLARGTRLRLVAAGREDILAESARADTGLVVPLSGSARHRVLAELAAGPSYLLLPFPQKPTPGVEYLGRAHLGVDARDYFCFHAPTDRGVEDRNRNVLVTVTQNAAPGHAPQLRVDLQGLNPADDATLEVVAETATGQRATLAFFPTAGARSFEKPAELRRLFFRLRGTVDHAEKSIAALDDRTADAFVRPAESDPLRVLGVELVARTAPDPIQVDARLLAPDGPFPQWNLPLTRAMRAETIRLTVPAASGLAKFRVSFSARMQSRPQGILAILCNGEELRRISFHEPMTWQQAVVEAPARPGTNVIELRDMPLPPSPDWSAYLERYPDVRLHLELTRQPPIEGARIHYESCGRAEGRTVVLVDQPRPAADALYYLFRSLRVEGLRP